MIVGIISVASTVVYGNVAREVVGWALRKLCVDK